MIESPTETEFRIINEKIEELRKDMNYFDDETNRRISNALNNIYTRLDNLQKQIDMIWEQVDRSQRKDLK